MWLKENSLLKPIKIKGAELLNHCAKSFIFCANRNNPIQDNLLSS
jgi:hypothetical protein